MSSVDQECRPSMVGMFRCLGLGVQIWGDIGVLFPVQVVGLG